MPAKKDNPLLGAFRAPVPDAPPDKPAEERNPVEPPKAAPAPKASGTTPDKPAAPPKTAPDPKASGTTPDKPTAPPKAAPDPKASGTTPDKPAAPPKAAPDPKASGTTPGKPVAPPKAAPDPKASGTTPDKPAEPPKAAPDPKDNGTTPDKPAELPKAAPDPKDNGTTPDKPAEPPKAAPDPKDNSTTPDKPAAPPKATPDPKDNGSTSAKADEEAKPAEPIKAEDEIPKDFTLPLTKAGQAEGVTTLKVADIHPFEGHPFNVKDDKDMWDLVDSVKKFGILEPAVVIPRDAGGFEMISGHRRRRACELAGITTMPVIVRQLDRDEATISMVDANLKRENISPMEKARAYTMKLEAMKRKAGRRTKEETARLKAEGKKPLRADEELAQQTGESRSNIQKISRLTKLDPELQQMVDDNKLPIHTAADISYLKKDEQKALADAIKKEDKVPTGAQAVELKKASQEGTLTPDKIEKTVAPTKREETPPLKLTLTEEELRPYFPDKRTTIPDAKRGVLEALDLRKKALERQKAKAETEKAGRGKKSPSPSR